MQPQTATSLRVRMPGHFVARVSGEDARGFLDATTSQDLALVRPGLGALTCVLDDKGRVRAEVRVLPLEGGDVLVDGEPAVREAVTGWLARIAPLSGCAVTDESDRWDVWAVRGEPGGGEAEHAFIERDGALLVRTVWGGDGHDVIAPAGTAFEEEGTTDDLDALRIAAGRPRFGVDVTDAMHVTETPLVERAVSHAKGCYPGQESVARVRNLGKPRRALAGLSGEGEPPAPGAAVERDGVEVGAVTSAAAHGSGWVAIALVRAETLEAPAVSVAGAHATVRAL